MTGPYREPWFVFYGTRTAIVWALDEKDASDRGWIEDSGDPAFLALLDDLVDA